MEEKINNMNIRPQLHVSMLDQISKCGIQFQRRYGYRFGIWEKEEIIKPGIALITGSSVHASVENDLTNKIQTGQLLSSEAVADITRTAFECEWQGGVILDDDEAYDIAKTKDAAVDKTVRLSLLHHNELAPTVLPLEVEKKFVIKMVNFPLDLAGKMDIREENAIGDVKTMGANRATVQSDQMAMYSVAFKIEFGHYPETVYHQKLIKTKEPKAIVESMKPDESWINPLFRRIERFIEIMDAVKSGKQCLMPADPGSWICSRRYCGFADSCKFFSGRN